MIIIVIIEIPKLIRHFNVKWIIGKSICDHATHFLNRFFFCFVILTKLTTLNFLHKKIKNSRSTIVSTFYFNRAYRSMDFHITN
jgi:hypothetical protein